MVRKLFCAILATVALIASGCGSVDYERGRMEGRAMVREMRKEGAPTLALELFPIQGGSASKYSADYQAGYRKGYMDEVKNP